MTEVVRSVVICARPEAVFRFFTDGERFARWWGKGSRTPLRFTKTGEARLEKIYARHFVWSGKGPFHPPGERSEAAQ